MSEITNSLGMTILETSFSSNAVIKRVCAESTYIENVLACPGGAYTKSTDARGNCGKGVCTGGACIKASCSKVTCIEDASIRDTYSRVACIGNTSAGGAYARSACVKCAFIGGNCDGSIYAGSASAVKHLGIHSQFFRILEVKLFGTGLKTRVGVG